ncbi:MAG: hydrolase [Peptococcaceae bacterium]|nr:hydrolase [Peptococcaceae bacterium]
MEKVLEQILAELKELRQGQDELRREQIAQGQRLERLEKGQAALEKGQAVLEKGQATLEKGQAALEERLIRLENGQKKIRKELCYIWDDIKKLDNRLTNQEEKLQTLSK